MWNPEDRGEWFFQRPPFAEAIAPPTAEVCDQPLYCFQVNGSYVPLICGALTALAQPSTFGNLTASDRALALGRIQDLIAEVAAAGPCAPTQITPPPGTDKAQQACNIAGYLSNMVIRESILQGVQAIQQELSILSFASILLSLIPGLGTGFGLAFLLFEQAVIKFLAQLRNGTLADYQAALSDDALWAEVACAIYNCIKQDGDVTDNNFPCIKNALCNLIYPQQDVKDAICGFISDMGAQNIISAQVPGIVITYSCECAQGIVGGPPYRPPLRQSGKARVLIAAGQALGQLAIDFVKTFDVIPVLIPGGTDKPIMLPAFTGATPAGFTIEVNAPQPVDVDTFVDVDWVAELPMVT